MCACLVGLSRCIVNNQPMVLQLVLIQQGLLQSATKVQACVDLRYLSFSGCWVSPACASSTNGDFCQLPKLRCLRVSPVHNGTHGSTLTGGHCAIVEGVLQLDLGDVLSLGFNVVPVHVPSSWPSVIDYGAYRRFVGWGHLVQCQVGKTLMVVAKIICGLGP
jgi:hypothetical protein